MLNIKNLKGKRLSLPFRFFFIAFLSLFSLQSGNCQKIVSTLYDSSIQSMKREISSPFSVVFVAGVTGPAMIRNMGGKYNIESSSMPAGELGFHYRKQISRSLNLVTGLLVAGVGRTATFDIPTDRIDPSPWERFPIHKNRNFDFALSIPLLLEKGWQKKNNGTIYGQAGISLRKSLMYWLDEYLVQVMDQNGRLQDVLYMDLNVNNYRKPWVSVNLGGGYQKQLKNKHVFSLGLMTNISYTQHARGTFIIDIPGEDLIEGTYGVWGSYIGVSAGYSIGRRHK